MRKTILLMLLAVISNSAMAGWTKVGSNENTVAYADLATTLSVGNRVKMWNLYDYNAAQKTSVVGESYLSARMQYEYDCKEKKIRMLDLTSHSKNMGEGKVIFKMNDPQDWKAFLPNNVQEVLWKVACGKDTAKAAERNQKGAAQGGAQYIDHKKYSLMASQSVDEFNALLDTSCEKYPNSKERTRCLINASKEWLNTKGRQYFGIPPHYITGNDLAKTIIEKGR